MSEKSQYRENIWHGAIPNANGCDLSRMGASC